MIGLVQRVKKASVTIEGKLFSSINSGLLVFVGVEKNDTEINSEKLAQKILNLRIFEDKQGKMNRSLLDVNGEILVVSQFTLCGNCEKGTRPSFDNSAQLNIARELYEHFVNTLKQSDLRVETGKFQAMMDVELTNDGPVTFHIKK